MIKRIVDILKDEGLVRDNGDMTYIKEKNGIRNVARMHVECDWGIETYDNIDSSPLYKGWRVAIGRCLTSYEIKREGAVEEEKKRVYLSVLQGILTTKTRPEEERVHIWTEDRDGFTYIYGAIKIHCGLRQQLLLTRNNSV